MSARQDILQRLRQAEPPAVALPELPAPAGEVPHGVALLPAFTQALERMGGRVVQRDTNVALEQQVAALYPDAKVIVSATSQMRGTRLITPAVEDPRELEDVDLGVVRGAFGVAETGSVALSEREFIVPALGFLPQHLLVLLDPQRLLPDLHAAYRERGFFAAGYATLMTGPSATADIEGVLIRGAQGIRSFTVLICAE